MCNWDSSGDDGGSLFHRFAAGDAFQSGRVHAQAQLESKIEAGNVLVADGQARLPIGYCMAKDRYFKRDDVGIIYQMNVVPGKHRSLVGASMVREVFNRAAYGCRLFCCWCAQDLDANYFWEAMGFVPLAFRPGRRRMKDEGGRMKKEENGDSARFILHPSSFILVFRMHIFWQRRIREGDETTPYWFPAKTDAGAMREDRIVLPIPPGVRWCDEMPVVLPDVARALRPCLENRSKQRSTGGAPVPRKQQNNIAEGGMRFRDGGDGER